MTSASLLGIGGIIALLALACGAVWALWELWGTRDHFGWPAILLSTAFTLGWLLILAAGVVNLWPLALGKT